MKKYNVTPYFDDFDESKDFHQIMFKPGYAVQARELTQLQTIIRDQIEKFGNHIFQHGSVVIPGNAFTELSVPFLKVQSQYNGVNIATSNFEGKTLIGMSTGIKAVVRKALPATSSDPVTFYLSYTSGSTTGSVVFDPSEELYAEEMPTLRATVASSSPTGVGSMAFVNSGVYYINGSFVHTTAQSVLISKYDSYPSCHILFQISETLVESTEDSTLLDPAQGSYNYAAPGADRVKTSLTLTTLPLGSAITEDYVELMRYNAGNLEEHAKNSKYSELDKSLARRTYDESGNYVVDGLVPTIRENLKQGNNGGVYPNGNTNKLVVEVAPGKAYISGFEVEKISNTRIDIDKARTVDHIKNTSLTLRPEFGQYLIVSNIVGTFSIYDHDTVSLYNDNDSTNSSATLVGTAKVVGIDYLAGDTAVGAIYKLWVTDIAFVSGYTIENVGGIRYNSTKYAYVLTEFTAPVSNGSYTVGEIVSQSTSGRTATVKYWDATTGTLYAYKHDHTKDTPKVGDRILGATSATTSVVTGKRLVVSVGQSGLIFRLPKTIPASLTNVAGTYSDLSYTVQKELSITTDVSGNGSVSVSSGIINPIEVGTFVAVGASGVVVNSKFTLNGPGTSLSLAGGPASSVVKVYCNVTKTGVSPKTKTLTTFSQSVTAPGSATITLDKTDIVSITSIVDSVGDITSHYALLNGQTDYAYNRGQLKLKTGQSAPVGNVTITYTYYQHSISGDFFCINSYSTVTDFMSSLTIYSSDSTGQQYDLGACLDFRPSVGADGTFTGTNSRRNDVIIGGTVFASSLQFYVPRIDALTVDSGGRFTVLTGTPNENPIAPQIPTSQFPINFFYIPEYTRSAESVTSRRLDVERFTMKDIKLISNRVGRLEEFATLTAAETAVANSAVVDADTGLDRFKTGYLVENFSKPFAMARTTSGDFAATFVGQTVQPSIESLVCNLEFQASSANYVHKNGFVMLPYTETPFAQQPLSSRVTNLNPFLVIQWNGIVSVNPPSDVWVEMADLPTVFEESTNTVVVQEIIPCPPPPPNPVVVIPPTPPVPDPIVEVVPPVEPPPPPPQPPYVVSSSIRVDVSYGGWYGTVLNRAGETGGVSYWTNEYNNVNGGDTAGLARNLLAAAEERVNMGPKGEFNYVPGYTADSLIAAAGNVLTSTTETKYEILSYSDGTQVTRAVGSITRGTLVDGTDFTQ